MGKLSSVRGMTDKDMVKTMRDRARYEIAAHNDISNNRFRPDRRIMSQSEFKVKPLKSAPIPVSRRGSDLKDQVLEGRKQAQHKKANSVFMSYTQPQNIKINGNLF